MEVPFELANILSLISTYGYPVIFVVSTLEGPTIAMVSGFLIATSVVSFLPVFVALYAGDLMGDMLYYIAGRKGGRNLLDRFGHRVGIQNERIEHYASAFARNDWLLLLFAKTQPLGTTILFSAGMAKHPFRRFIGINAVISVPKTMLLMGIGYFFGEAIVSAERYSSVALASAVGVIILVGIFFGLRLYIRRNFN